MNANAPRGPLCPKCQVPLQVDERACVQIDSCPECRGVWLDRGELDKILVRVEGEYEAHPVAERPSQGYPPLLAYASPSYASPATAYHPHYVRRRDRHHRGGFLGKLFGHH